MRVIRLQIDSGKGGLVLAANHKKEILDEVGYFIDGLSISDNLTLTAEEMEESKYKELPEFTGW